MLPTCMVRIENTRVIVGKPSLQPDILITGADRAPVVIEAEFMPAATAEQEAKDRLGLEVVDGRRQIEAAIALRYPEGFEFTNDISGGLADARLEYAVFYKDETRFPESGWLRGTPADLADIARLVSVPQSAVDAATDALQSGIDRAAAILKDLNEQHPAITQTVATLLGMSDVPQTHRMACAIIANALVFHDRVADIHGDIKPLRLVCNQDVANPQREIIAEWTRILAINYWPIFAVSRDIIEQIPTAEASRMLRLLEYTAGDVAASGANVEHDLTGRIFQRLIADRKYLATFYTLPASAALLARLAISKLENSPSPSQPVIPAEAEPAPVQTGESQRGDGGESSQKAPSPLTGEGWDGGDQDKTSSPSCPSMSDSYIDWSDPAAIAKLRIGDFACGTGALLSAVYEQIATRHEQAGGDPAALHTAMMEEVLYGCDVMPSAIHITSSTLSGAQPTVGYKESRLYNMPYGRQSDGTVAIGSLELLQSSSVMTLFNTSDPAMRTGSAGEETAASVNADIQDESFDIVIMNPPFTSNTKHYDADDGVLNAAFAAFNASKQEQDDMAARMRAKSRNTCYHGHAGLASAFAALADRKVKPGGVVAFVLPFTAINGASWAKFRELIATRYTDVTVVSIAANGKDMSFSSDTGIAECLIIGRKLRRNDEESPRAKFASLRRRPYGFVHAMELAKDFSYNAEVRRIEDGPYGGRPIYCGEEPNGEMLDASLESYANGWGAARILDASVAQTAKALSNGNLWLPGEIYAPELPFTSLNNIGRLGVHDSFLTLKTHNGPFTKEPPSRTATYPLLHNHNAKQETRMVCTPDFQLRVRLGMEDKAAELWTTASRCHLNRDFTFGSQALAVAFTEPKSLGGRAWPNIFFDEERFDYAFSLWGNSSLGLLSYWWHSSRQQSSKASMTRLVIPSLPILDFRTLTDDQLAIAKDIFDDFRNRDLKPAYLADADPNRALLDRRVICDLLGFDHNIYEAVRLLAAKWCAEPSVHGGKKRPKGASVVI